MMLRRARVLLWLCMVFVLGVLEAGHAQDIQVPLPVVVNTWPWPEATQAGFLSLVSDDDGVQAVVAGCSACERLQCDHTVGFGGSPSETGEVTLDAMIMDGDTLNVGAVGCLRRIKSAIAVAQHVLYNTKETLLVGELATEFAVQMGFATHNLSTEHSDSMHTRWLDSECQPNYWTNVLPDPTKHCGPYHPLPHPSSIPPSPNRGHALTRPAMHRYNHDTIGMVAVNSNGSVTSGTSTNGANAKIAGRVGDAPIAGAGSYADSELGGCAATGDGDIMMRQLPCFQAVSLMDTMSPTEAARTALKSIARRQTAEFQGALVVVSAAGVVGAASWGWNFHYTYQAAGMSKPQVVLVPRMDTA